MKKSNNSKKQLIVPWVDSRCYAHSSGPPKWEINK